MAPVPAVGVWVWGAAALPEFTAREQRKRGGRAAGRKEPMLGKPAGPQPSCALCLWGFNLCTGYSGAGPGPFCCVAFSDPAVEVA